LIIALSCPPAYLLSILCHLCSNRCSHHCNRTLLEPPQQQTTVATTKVDRYIRFAYSSFPPYVHT